MTTSEQTVGATQETLHKRKVAMTILGGFFLLVGLLWLLHWLIWGRFEEFTDNAYVSGNLVQLMPQIPGTVVEINTDNTLLVNEGQVIIKLDTADYRLALQRAEAELAQTVRQVRQYYEAVAQAKQRLALDKANLLKAQLDLKRRMSLVGNRAVSREDMEHYKTAAEGAQARYNVSLHQLDAALALVQNASLYKHPMVETAKANLKTAWLNYQRTTIVAPITGYVAKRNIQPGQQVSPNSVLLSIIPLDNTWVDANFKESSLENLRVDQPVTLYADAYPGISWHGKVEGLSAGTGSAFALLPAQNATGNWIKIVQRLPVRIRLNKDELNKNPLQLGLSMEVTVNTHNRSGTRMPTKSESLYRERTTVFARQLADVDQLVDKILKANSPDMSLPEEVG